MYKSTETQRHYLQAVDPKVKEAIRKPHLSSRDLKGVTLPQLEAISEAVEQHKILGQEYANFMATVPDEDKGLILLTAQTLFTSHVAAKGSSSEGQLELPPQFLLLALIEPDAAERIFLQTCAFIDLHARMAQAGMAEKLMFLTQEINEQTSE